MARRQAEAAELLSDQPDLYDGPSISDDLTGDCVPADRDETSVMAASAARDLRQEIYAGRYPAGSKFPARRALAVRFRSTEGTMNRALQMLAREGLLNMGAGRDTTVVPLTAYLATVSVPGPEGPPGDDAADALCDAMSAAEEAEPAVADLDMAISGRTWEWTMTVRAASAAMAAVIAMRMARRSAVSGEWDWPKASVSAEPSL